MNMGGSGRPPIPPRSARPGGAVARLEGPPRSARPGAAVARLDTARGQASLSTLVSVTRTATLTTSSAAVSPQKTRS